MLFLVYIPIIVYHGQLFVNLIPKPVHRHSRLVYEANLFNNNFNNFNKFLTILKCSVDLEYEFNVTNDSCMNSNFYIVDFYSLTKFTRSNFVKALTRDNTSISIFLDPLFLCLLFFSQCFLIYFQRIDMKRG